LLLRRHTAPDEKLRLHIGRGCIPAVLVEPDGFALVAVLHHHLTQQLYTPEIELLTGGCLLRRRVFTVGVGRHSIEVAASPCIVHLLQVIELVQIAVVLKALVGSGKRGRQDDNVRINSLCVGISGLQ
jgi:hypothetical protein